MPRRSVSPRSEQTPSCTTKPNIVVPRTPKSENADAPTPRRQNHTTITTGTAASTSAWARRTAATRSRAARSRAAPAATPTKIRTALSAGRRSPRRRPSSRVSRSRRHARRPRALYARGRGHTPSAAPSYLLLRSGLPRLVNKSSSDSVSSGLRH